MEKIQSILNHIRTDFQAGKSTEEVLSTLSSLIGEDLKTAKEVAENLPSIPEIKTAQLLEQMFDLYSEKEVRKAIKRSLYILRSRGIRFEHMISQKGKSVIKPIRAEDPQAIGSGYNSYGDRFLLLTLHHLGAGWELFNGIVNDIKGLVAFSTLFMSKKEMVSLITEVKEESPGEIVEMEPSYVGFLFYEAYKLTIAQGKEVPPQYLSVKDEIEKIKKSYDKPFIYSLIQEEEIERDEFLLEMGSTLFNTELFSSWRILEEEIRPYAGEVQEAEQSPIILTTSQKEARFHEIFLKAISNLFTETNRSLFRRRMEEMAYLLYQMGKGKEARVSLAIALDLKKPPNPFRPNPFLYTLVTRSIFALLSENYKRESKEPSFIIKP
ncbi:MAG: hypothetical protein ACUVTN_05560 [Thermodesulfobacteriota bacterium]